MRSRPGEAIDFSPRDVYFNEILATRGRLPPAAATVPTRAGDSVPIHVIEPHGDFLHAVSVDDVAALLGGVPSEYLVELPRVVLLGGSKRQASLRFDDGVFGHYDPTGIFLHAFPRRHLEVEWRWAVRDDDLDEFLRWGARSKPTALGTRLSFDAASLRAFYLYDVLLHELGHHVDRRRRSDDAAEKFAHWFADAEAAALGALAPEKARPKPR